VLTSWKQRNQPDPHKVKKVSERLEKVQKYVESTGVTHSIKKYVTEAHFHFRNPPKGNLKDTLALMGLTPHPENPHCMVLLGLTANMSETRSQEAPR